MSRLKNLFVYVKIILSIVLLYYNVKIILFSISWQYYKQNNRFFIIFYQVKINALKPFQNYIFVDNDPLDFKPPYFTNAAENTLYQTFFEKQ